MKRCKHELETKRWKENYYEVEYIIQCKKCGVIKEHWSYGVMFYKDWLAYPFFELNTIQRFLYKYFKRYRKYKDKKLYGKIEVEK